MCVCAFKLVPSLNYEDSFRGQGRGGVGVIRNNDHVNVRLSVRPN